MAKGASTLVVWFIGLVVGFIIGWFVHRTAATLEARDHLIRVHRDGSLSEPEAKISRGLKNKIVWTADAGARLEIAFPQAAFPSKAGVPFQGMKSRQGPRGTEWLVTCEGENCFSGEISTDLPREDGLKYKYDQIVDEKRVDGWIIIDR
jgi:hypothetical protein